LVAIRLGEVRLVIAAAPRYLALSPRIAEPGDLAKHQIISMTHFGQDSWSFPPFPGSAIPRTVKFTPRMVVNSVRGAVASVVEGRGVTRVFSYQVAEHVRKGEVEILLGEYEPPPTPVNVVSPHGRLSVPKVRAFVDFAVPRLKKHFAHLTIESPIHRSGRGPERAKEAAKR
jgi:DNA-binding transcriptional LysR family regulator